MKINDIKTKYNIGDVVIITWQDDIPEMAKIVGIKVVGYLSDAEPLLLYELDDHLARPNEEKYDHRTEGGILCKVDDPENIKKMWNIINKAFNDHGYYNEEDK